MWVTLGVVRGLGTYSKMVDPIIHTDGRLWGWVCANHQKNKPSPGLRGLNSRNDIWSKSLKEAGPEAATSGRPYRGGEACTEAGLPKKINTTQAMGRKFKAKPTRLGFETQTQKPEKKSGGKTEEKWADGKKGKATGKRYRDANRGRMTNPKRKPSKRPLGQDRTAQTPNKKRKKGCIMEACTEGKQSRIRSTRR